MDFEQDFEFLDKELDELFPQKGEHKHADKLIKVFTKSGKEQWILVHVEIQGYKDENFAKRMFTYFYRIQDRWQKDIMALAIYTDKHLKFHPNKYEYQFQETKLSYEFKTFDIFKKPENELIISENPFSLVMRTAKKALAKDKWSDAELLGWKKDLVLELKQAGYSTKKIRRILGFIKFYVKFRSEESKITFESDIVEMFNFRKPMGIEEAILHQATEQAKEKGWKEGNEKGLEEGLKEGVQKGIQEGLKEGIQKGQQEEKERALKNIIQSIQKAIVKDILTFEQMVEIFNVELEFVQKIYDQDIYIDDNNEIIGMD